MTSAELLIDAFGRIKGIVHKVVDGLSPEQLTWRASSDANTIAWLVWHLTRIQDDHIADVVGIDQKWTADGWFERFELPFERTDTGYGHSSDQVASVRVRSGELLEQYHDAVHDQTERFLSKLTDADLDRVVDENWNPPVTLGVRLVSVIGDDMQHAGQAAYVRGLLP